MLYSRVPLIACTVSFGANQQSNTKPHTSTASPLKARIPPPNRSVYSAVREGQKWGNPYLIVTEDGVQARKKGDDGAASIRRPPDLELALWTRRRRSRSKCLLPIP